MLATVAHLDISVEGIVKIYCDAKNNYCSPDMIGNMVSNYLIPVLNVGKDLYNDMLNMAMQVIFHFEYYFYTYDTPLPIVGYSVEKRAIRFLCGGYDDVKEATQIFDYR